MYSNCIFPISQDILKISIYPHTLCTIFHKPFTAIRIFSFYRITVWNTILIEEKTCQQGEKFMKKKIHILLSIIAAIFIAVGLIHPFSASAENTSPASLVTLNKTASPLDENLETKMELSFPGVDDNLASDIVFVLDKSGASDQTGINQKAMEFLDNLHKQAIDKGVNVKVGVVLFNRIGNIKRNLTDIGTGYDDIKKAMTSSVSMGTNLHSGLLAGKKLLDEDTSVLNSRKHLVLITDGATYLYSKNNDYTTSYTKSFGDPTKQINPATGNPFKNSSDKKGGIWEYQSREYNVAESLTFSNAMKDPNQLKIYLDEKRAHNSDYEKYEYGYDYLSAYLNIGRKVTPISADAVANIDTAFINADDTFSEIASKYKTYVFFKNTADFDGSNFLKYMTRNTCGLSTDFVELEKAVNHMIDTGSSLDDEIGKDFDFVNDPSKISISVGDEKLEPVKLSDNLYGFGPRGDGSYRFLLTYTNNNGKETLKLDINEAVKTTAPLKLNYSEKLVNVPTKPGAYKFNTNESAVLNLVDSSGNSLGSLNFPYPLVNYTVQKETTTSETTTPETTSSVTDTSTEITTTGTNKSDKPKVETAPETGDRSNTSKYIFAFIIAGAVFAIIILGIHKKRS